MLRILKKLFSQTAIYGLSSIVGRFLNYLLVPLYTYSFSASEYGVVAEFYAYAGFFSVLLVCGFETGYFRFRNQDFPERDTTYSTALITLMVLNALFFLGISLNNQHLANLLNYPQHPEYLRWFSLILILDAIAALPFARLRAENKALRFASIKMLEILITIALNVFFVLYLKKFAIQYPHSFFALCYNPEIGVGYIFIANLLASFSKFFLLIPQLKAVAWGFDKALCQQLFKYSLPMVVIGFAGIINEMLDRVLLKYLLPYDTQTNLKMLGIYSACYKLSILMTLFIQAFRYAAEPFFFSYASQKEAKLIYAQVLNFFVIFCVFIFLLVTLYLNFFQYFIGKEFRSGLKVVPILLLANLCLGVYVNLSIWYKLTDRTLMGAWVSIAGALLTILLNKLWIPEYGYLGSAWATLVCYASMMLVSYGLGQIYYPVRYAIGRILGYSLLGIGLYLANVHLSEFSPWKTWIFSGELLLVFLLTVVLFEKRAITF